MMSCPRPSANPTLFLGVMRGGRLGLPRRARGGVGWGCLCAPSPRLLPKGRSRPSYDAPKVQSLLPSDSEIRFVFRPAKVRGYKQQHRTTSDTGPGGGRRVACGRARVFCGGAWGGRGGMWSGWGVGHAEEGEGGHGGKREEPSLAASHETEAPMGRVRNGGGNGGAGREGEGSAGTAGVCRMDRDRPMGPWVWLQVGRGAGYF